MRFDILSNKTIAERAMREDLLRRKYRAKEETARAATMRGRAAITEAETGARVGEQRFGPEGLVGEELGRRYPYGVPAKEAETARISATGYAESVRKGAKTAAGRLGLEREEFEFGKEYLGRYGERPGRDAVEEIRGIAEGTARPGVKCPKGFRWDGTSCVPSM
jgi:hypothetical protein